MSDDGPEDEGSNPFLRPSDEAARPPVDPRPAWARHRDPAPPPAPPTSLFPSSPTAPPPAPPPAPGTPPPPSLFTPPPGSAPPAPPAGPPPAWPPSPGAWPPGAWPPQPTAPPRTRRLLLPVALVLVLLAAAVGVGAFVLTRGGDDDDQAAGEPGRTYPEQWDPRVQELAEWTADERDLEFEHPVEVVFLPADEYRDQAAGEPSEADEEAAQEAEDFVAVLRALGFVQGEVDLEESSRELSGEGTLAYYTAEEEKVYVRGTELTPAVRVTVVHELTHVLQDQHFDLERLGDPDFDRASELRTLIEGDAQRIEQRYVREGLSGEEREEYLDETGESVDQSESDLADVPPALVALFSAPYTLGRGFVTYYERIDGPDAIDDLIREPPSEQELLDPGSRGTSRADEVEVDVEAPEGAEVLDEDTFGPLALYLLLASRIEPTVALTAVDGWGGDAFVSYREDDEVCAAVTLVGDDPAATERLNFVLSDWASRDPGGRAEVQLADDEVRLVSCDPGADAAGAGEVSAELLVVPAVRAEFESQILAAGGNQEQAECAADGILAEFTLEELTATEPDPEAQRRAQEIVIGCR